MSHRDILSAVPSRHLGRARDVVVHSPPGLSKRERLAVLYLSDGQNLFDPATSFIPGRHWRLSETVDRLVEEGSVEPLLVVGIYNTGADRIDEYTPTVDERHARGGAAALYGRFLVEELKPLIEERYRVWTGPRHTGLGGSSLGALAALAIGIERPDVFGKLLLMSPSVWWGSRDVLRSVDALPGKTGQRIWVDIGTAEGEEALDGARALRDAKVRKGWALGRDLAYHEAPDAGHDESAWGDRAPQALRYLYPSWRPGRRVAHAMGAVRRLARRAFT